MILDSKDKIRHRHTPCYVLLFIFSAFAWTALAQAEDELSTAIDSAVALENQDALDAARDRYATIASEAKKIENWSRWMQAQLGFHRCLFASSQYDSVVGGLTIFFDTLPPMAKRDLYRAKLYDLLGRAHERKGQYTEAIEAGLKAFADKEQIGAEREELALSLDLLGDCHRSLDQMQQARKLYEDLLDLYLSNGIYEDHIKVAGTFADLAILDRIEGKYELAIERYRQAEIMIEKFPEAHWSTLASIYNGLGIIYATIGDHPRSLAYFQKLVKSDLENLDTTDPDLARSHTNLGIIYEMMGDFKQSVQLHEKALSIKVAALGENHPSLLYDYKGLANVYNNIGDIEQTLIYLHKTEQLELEHLGSQSRNLAMSYNLMGSSYRLKEDFDKAKQYLLQAETIITTIDEQDPQAGPIYHNLASLYLGQLNYRDAKLYARKALATNQKNFGRNHQHVAGNLIMLGSISESEGDLAQAAEYYEKSLAISIAVDGATHQNVAKAFSRLANVSRLSKQYDKSLQYAQKALISGSTEFKDTLVTVNPDVHQTHIPKDMASTLTIKGEIFKDLYFEGGQLDLLIEALAAFEAALDMINAAQFSYQAKGSVAHLKKEFVVTYENAIECSHLLYQEQADPIYIDKALHFAELSKSTLLVAALNESRARDFAGIPSALLERELNLRRDITYFEQLGMEQKISLDSASQIVSKIFALKQSYDKLIREFEDEYPEYYRLKFDASTVSIDELRENILGPDETFLEYFMGRDRGYGIAINRDDAYIFQIENMGNLENDIRQLSSFLKKKDQDVRRFISLAQGISRQLIDPVKIGLLTRKLIIVPDGIINYLPFEILITESALDTQYENFDLPYLFKEHPVSYAYSGTVLRKSNRLQPENNRSEFLAFAPVFSNRDAKGNLLNPSLIPSSSTYRSELADLEGARKEVSALSTYFKGTVHSSIEATEGRFKQKAPQYGILHLATHAIIDDLNPMNSKLLFTAASDSLEDADLHAWEIFNLKLNAQLAVLSACNTGFGNIQRGEGVLSLGRAFAFAGCPSIVMSLWPAQDQITSAMMSEFYANLAEGQNKDEALRQAKISYLKNADEFNLHPFYWAGFILQGDPSQIVISGAYRWAWTASIGIIILSLVWVWRNRHDAKR